MILPVEQVVEILAREWHATLDRLERATEEQWWRPTRCERWGVLDLAAHMVWGTSLEADGLRRARLGTGGHAEGKEVAPEDERLLELLSVSVGHLVAETGLSAGRDAAVPMPYGDIDPDVARSIFVMEAAVHGSDLAHALGSDDTLAADVLEPTALVLSLFLPVTAAQGEDPPAGTGYRLVGDHVELGFVHGEGGWEARLPEAPTAVIAGSDSDILLFVLGRRPLEGLEVEGSEEAAARFKRYLPGL